MDRLKALIARIRLFYSPTREPLRRSVYTSLLVLVPVLVTAGVLTGAGAASLLGLLPILLAVPVEKARSLVTPVADPNLTDAPGRHAVDHIP